MFGSRFYHVPDCFGCDSVAPDLIQSTYSAEDRAVGDGSRPNPLIDGAFRPQGNRDGTDVLSLANKVSNHAMIFADLKIFRPESH
jgi:hypothetical protein